MARLAVPSQKSHAACISGDSFAHGPLNAASGRTIPDEKERSASGWKSREVARKLLIIKRGRRLNPQPVPR